MFKSCKLEALAIKARPPEEAASAAAAAKASAAGGTTPRAGGSSGSSKSARVQHCSHSAGKMPGSMTGNSAKEAALLAYVGDYVRVFQELYPHRWGGGGWGGERGRGVEGGV